MSEFLVKMRYVAVPSGLAALTLSLAACGGDKEIESSTEQFSKCPVGWTKNMRPLDKPAYAAEKIVMAATKINIRPLVDAPTEALCADSRGLYYSPNAIAVSGIIKGLGEESR